MKHLFEEAIKKADNGFNGFANSFSVFHVIWKYWKSVKSFAMIFVVTLSDENTLFDYVWTNKQQRTISSTVIFSAAILLTVRYFCAYEFLRAEEII